MIGRHVLSSSALGLTVLLAPTSVRAQLPHRYEAAVGVAQPTGDLAPYRGSGPAARIGVEFGKPAGIARMRVDLEAVMLTARSTPATRTDGTGQYRALGAFASYIVGPTWGSFAPYVLAGVGMHVPSIPGKKNPYGAVFGGHAGGGLRVRRGRYNLALEITRHALLTDYGATEEFGHGGYRPVTLSVQF